MQLCFAIWSHSVVVLPWVFLQHNPPLWTHEKVKNGNWPAACLTYWMPTKKPLKHKKKENNLNICLRMALQRLLIKCTCNCSVFSPAFLCVVRLFHFIRTASGTWVTIAMGARFGPRVLFGVLCRAFDVLRLWHRRLLICGLADRCVLLFAGLSSLRLYLLLDGCVFLDGRFLVSSWTGVRASQTSGGARLCPAAAFLLGLAVFWRVGRGQALCVGTVVGSTWPDENKQCRW